MKQITLKNKKVQYIVGIDEAGRGPLAGPVTVGAFCVNKRQYDNKTIKRLFSGARDSKKMSEKKRKEMFERIKLAQRDGLVRYIVQMESAQNIDTKGISWCIRNCIRKCLAKLSLPDSVAPRPSDRAVGRSAKRGYREKLDVDSKTTLVLLDGGIKAPPEFIHQKTIIRGDDKELVISLTSICAKVTRDAHMKKLAKKYPHYGLDIHKGYGTLVHRTAIARHGVSDIHRKTFCRNIDSG
jgi:ribonuclease HII